MTAPIHFTRLTLKRDAPSVAPLIGLLAPVDSGEALSVGHRLMWTVMPEATRRAAAREMATFLWRSADDGRKYYMLGPPPVADSPLFRIETKPFEPKFVRGDRLTFDLRVNATVDRKVGVADDRAVRKRTDVALDRLHRDEDGGAPRASRATRRLQAAQEAAESWLHARSERDGFRLISTRLIAYRAESLPRRNRAPAARIGVFDLQGALDVQEPEAFLRRVVAGFGRAKAFGCGLMLLRRAPRE